MGTAPFGCIYFSVVPSPSPVTIAASWIAFALAAAAVLAYWAYTIGGVRFLAPLLWNRRPLVGASAALAVATFLLAVAGGPTATPAPFALVATLAVLLYAARRQWAWPRAVPPYRPERNDLPPAAGTPVAVLADGCAVPLAYLARDRVARVGDTLLVHCSLAGSLAAFADPGPTAAVLPLESGFAIRSGKHVWDGVDGQALDDGAPLERRPVARTTYARWREAHPEGTLFVGRGHPPPLRERRPVVPGARGLDEPMLPGEVVDGSWRPLPEAEATHAEQPAPRIYLARWAAKQRGLGA